MATGPWPSATIGGGYCFEDPASYFRTWLADEELQERWHDIDKGRRIRHWGCTLQVNGVYQHDRQSHMD